MIDLEYALFSDVTGLQRRHLGGLKESTDPQGFEI